MAVHFDTVYLCAPVAQLDRVTDYESAGWGFNSLQAHQLNQGLMMLPAIPFYQWTVLNLC